MAEDNASDFDEEKEGAEAEAAAKLEVEEKEEGKEEEGKENKEDEEKKEEEDFDEDEEPPTRKSAKDHIIERKTKKIEKLEKEKEEEAESEEEDEENPFSEEDKKAIKKEVSKETEPLKEVLKAQSDKNELEAVILKHPEAKAMEKRIMKYAKHKAYQDIPMENIYLMLANGKNNLQAKKTEAKEKDKENASIGHTKREKSGGEPDYENMSDEEFDEVDRKLTEGQ